MTTSLIYNIRGPQDVKICGGTFSGDLNRETIDALIRQQRLGARVLRSGRVVFVDAAGREVRLYLCISPKETAVGRAALEKEAQERAAALKRLKAKERRLDELLSGLSLDEAIQKLSSEV